LHKKKNPLSYEEIHFIRTFQIMKINENEKVESLGTAAAWEGNGNMVVKMVASKRLLGAIESKAETCMRDSPALFQTDNLDAPSHSLQYLAESARSLQDALQ
jgi:hypothetical protein